MNVFWQTLRAELIKQRSDSFKGRMVFFSLLLWPALMFVSAYFAMKPYRNGAGSAISQFIPGGNVSLFLLSGFLIFQLFWTVVQSAWTFERERQMGTLELVWLTPASKMAFLFGRSIYALLSGMWMFVIFSVLIFVFVADFDKVLWGYFAFSLVLALISALVWGVFLCSICLFSRDSSFIYYIFQDPMSLFGGVRIPITVFPIWAKVCSFFFPVTYSLFLLREAIGGSISGAWWDMALALMVLNAGIIIVTIRILVKAESYARRNGSWTLF
ncbi:ABC transporter permease [Paenibacillus sp. GP183]|jgi:ABC-2 type transport system permease protein|uniref:ABC transporter permease n=1 Tax=Paenibacillus sp. GP183 TaxID=1882751 RepID=UPI00089AFE8F|nr:ABC transporter permease [Paenibacillus sp. GP183]SEC28298.1 ABC-2 type transport system permease protein [Paenibacillus sp. GP183]